MRPDESEEADDQKKHHGEKLCLPYQRGCPEALIDVARNGLEPIRLAEELGPGHTIVTILCDGGQRYQSKLFNPAFLKEKGLPVPAWLDDSNSRTLPTVFEGS